MTKDFKLILIFHLLHSVMLKQNQVPHKAFFWHQCRFGDIADRLLNVDQKVLADLTEKLAKGEYIKPATEAEKSCFQVIHDLDHVSGKMHGSTTSKKYMRNEIWSLINFVGAPYWYITLSPAEKLWPIW